MRLNSIPAKSVVCAFLLPLALVGQQSTAPPNIQHTPEFPVVLKQNVIAGKTPVGTQVQARLEIATLVEGKVIPRNAILSGEVVESATKTPSSPSRLSIRLDSARWKNETATIKVYLTPWYYPTTTDMGQNLQYGPPEAPSKTWNGQGQYPSPNSPGYQPFPGRGTDEDKSSVPDVPAARTSDHRILMKDVKSERAPNADITLVSDHANIKLDRITTYVFAAGDLMPSK